MNDTQNEMHFQSTEPVHDSQIDMGGLKTPEQQLQEDIVLIAQALNGRPVGADRIYVPDERGRMLPVRVVPAHGGEVKGSGQDEAIIVTTDDQLYFRYGAGDFHVEDATPVNDAFQLMTLIRQEHPRHTTMTGDPMEVPPPEEEPVMEEPDLLAQKAADFWATQARPYRRREQAIHYAALRNQVEQLRMAIEEAAPQSAREEQMMSMMERVLETLARPQPQPIINVAPPQVTVNPPQVTIAAPPPAQVVVEAPPPAQVIVQAPPPRRLVKETEILARDEEGNMQKARQTEYEVDTGD